MIIDKVSLPCFPYLFFVKTKGVCKCAKMCHSPAPPSSSARTCTRPVTPLPPPPPPSWFYTPSPPPPSSPPPPPSLSGGRRTRGPTCGGRGGGGWRRTKRAGTQKPEKGDKKIVVEIQSRKKKQIGQRKQGRTCD